MSSTYQLSFSIVNSNFYKTQPNCIHIKGSKKLAFNNLKSYFIYFNILIYNTLNIKDSILTYNILKQHKQFLPTYTHKSHSTATK